MKKAFEYKGYTGSVDFDLEQKCLYGKALFLSDTVIYQGDTLEELEKCFQDGIDEYLETCEEIGKEPEKPFKGTFNVRMEPALHKSLARQAAAKGVTLNSLVILACKDYLSSAAHPTIVHNHTHKYVNYQYSLGSEGSGRQSGEPYSVSRPAHIESFDMLDQMASTSN